MKKKKDSLHLIGCDGPMATVVVLDAAFAPPSSTSSSTQSTTHQTHSPAWILMKHAAITVVNGIHRATPLEHVAVVATGTETCELEGPFTQTSPADLNNRLDRIQVRTKQQAEENYPSCNIHAVSSLSGNYPERGLGFEFAKHPWFLRVGLRSMRGLTVAFTTSV